MKSKRTYKHTQAYLKKKAQKEIERKKKLEELRAERLYRICIEHSLISPWVIFILWMDKLYNISELELLFGSNDVYLQKRVEIARKYIDEVYKKNVKLYPDNLLNYFEDYAIEEFFGILGINPEYYSSIDIDFLRNEILEFALDYVYYFKGDPKYILRCHNLSEDESYDAANKFYEKINNSDLKKGTKESRNSKRLECLKVILKNFKNIEKKEVYITTLAKELSIDRHTLSKYYNRVKFLIKYGKEVDEHCLDEKKRGRKENPYSVISEAALQKLEEALEDIPEKYGLEYASWTGEAIIEFLFRFFNIKVSFKYLYKFLNRHGIIKKAAGRKNPKSNPDEIKKFKNSLYKIFKKAIIKDLIILFADETHVQQGSRAYGYAKKGKKAVYSYHTENLHCDHTLLTFLGFNFIEIFKHKGTMKAENYTEYLKQLHEKYPDKRFLIFRDNAKVHSAGELSEKFNELGLGNYFTFESFPPYTPQLNPVELFNNEFKLFLKKYSCRNRSEVSNRTNDFINKFKDKEDMSTKIGRRKARQYIKGESCCILFDNYLLALKDIRKEKNLEKIKKCNPIFNFA